MTKEKEAEQKSDALMLIKDPERGGKIVPADMQRAMEGLAKDMGLDLRLGHLMVLGGRPYIGKAGIQYLLQKADGPGIKDVKFNWIRSEWDLQEFIVECVLETNAGDVYRGEGDAMGVPKDELMRIHEDAREAAKSGASFNRETYKARMKTGVQDYPMKNVTWMIAQNLHCRRMAQTRAFNRAGALAVKSTLPTSEEHVLVKDYTDAEYQMIEDEEPPASDEQVKKIMEFHKSKSEGIKKLFGEQLEYGPPDTWPKDIASAFITRAFEIKEAEKMKAKEDIAALEGKSEEVKALKEKKEEKPKDKAKTEEPKKEEKPPRSTVGKNVILDFEN